MSTERYDPRDDDGEVLLAYRTREGVYSTEPWTPKPLPLWFKILGPLMPLGIPTVLLLIDPWALMGSAILVNAWSVWYRIKYGHWNW